MSDRKRPQSEFLDQFESQLRFLERSVDWFDDGDAAEAQRIALSLRVLLHTTNRQVSLLQHLGRPNESFLDTRVLTEVPGRPYSGLVVLAVSSTNDAQRYTSLLGDSGPTVPFKEWWDATILADGAGVKLSRKELITTAADQDGGAHVDAKLNEPYARMSRDDALGWNPLDLPSGVEQSAAMVSIRQIAHEVLVTLKPGYNKQRITSPNETLMMGPATGVRVKVLEWRPPGTSGEEPEGILMEIKFPVDPLKLPRLHRCPCGSGKRVKHCHGSLTGK